MLGIGDVDVGTGGTKQSRPHNKLVPTKKKTDGSTGKSTKKTRVPVTPHNEAAQAEKKTGGCDGNNVWQRSHPGDDSYDEVEPVYKEF